MSGTARDPERSRFREVFRFEIGYRLRRVSTWVYAGILSFLAFQRIQEDAWDAPDGMFTTAPETLVEFSIVLGLIGLLVTAAIFGDAATRDFRTGMYPLLFTTRLRRGEYLAGRFAAAFLINALLLTLVPIGMAIATRMPYLDPEKVGPFRLAAFVQPYLVFILPNLALSATVLFAIAALARHTLPAYLGGIGLFFGYLLGTSFLGDGQVRQLLDDPTLAALADPFGLGAVQGLTRYWPIVERNTRLIGLPPVLLWNRVAWLSVAAAILWLLYRRFRFEHVSERGRGRRRLAVGGPAGRSPASVALPRVAGTFDLPARARQALAIARLSLREIARSKAILVGLVWALLVVFNFGFSVGIEVFDTTTWPVTHLIAGEVLGSIEPILVLLLVVLAGELIWSDRETRVSEIADAAPVSDAVSLLGRFLALMAVVTIFQTVLLGAGVAVQALQGYYRFELGLYARILFGIRMIDFGLLAVLILAVHVVVSHKYLGHLVAVLCFGFMRGAGSLHPIRHNLLVYGGDPGWVYSDLSGFGPFVAPYLWFNAYWAAWALLLAVGTRLLWSRGNEPGLRARLREARARLTGATARLAAVAGAMVATLGAFVFYNTNVLNEYRTPWQSLELQAEYERRYKGYWDVPLPRITAASVRVEIFPDDGAVFLHGSYDLVNRTARPIESVHLSIAPGVEVRSINPDREARPVIDDPELGYRIYRLARPLPPGGSMRLDFDVARRPRGFPNARVPTAVVGNGAYFDRRWLPAIGYQPGREVEGDGTRELLGLPPRDVLPSPYTADAEALAHRSDTHDADLLVTDVVIGTEPDQIAVTPGTLRRTWTENGRRYFHYRTERATSFSLATFSAEYAVHEGRWGDVALRIYHHPTHSVNLDRMMRSLKASLAYYSEQFGPYPYDELRIAEFPRYESFARAHPHTIAFSEGNAFITRVREGDVDLPFFVVAHETAHQWWGALVGGAAVAGAPFLSESLANYSAMMVMETTLGRQQARDYYDFQMDRYLGARGSNRRGPETPLLEVGTEPYVYYGKGAVALYTLREHIGADALNRALRRYLEKYRDAGPPYPTSLDLYAELRAVTPETLHPLLRDLFEEITLWDVRADRAVMVPTGDGGYRVTLTVSARKVRSDSVGTESEVPMDDVVEIGVFGPGRDGEPLYLRRHRIRSGEQSITVTVSGEPARAGIDPFGKLIQRDASDNRVEVVRTNGR